jgi:hypothetical protein
VEKEEDTKNMIGLTKDQRNRLINASSPLRTDERAKLTLAESEVIAKRIDQVLYELHMENPLAFVTNASLTLDGVEFLPITSMTKRRSFYDEPVKIKSYDYKSYVRPLKRLADESW